jgi:hypothetical protein
MIINVGLILEVNARSIGSSNYGVTIIVRDPNNSIEVYEIRFNCQSVQAQMALLGAFDKLGERVVKG